MKKAIAITMLGAMLPWLNACETMETVPSRTNDVRGGPDLVFNRPVGEIIGELEGAAITGPNGRVGNEFVFWGYRLQDNRQVNLYACAMLDDVNCESRLRAVCPGRGSELARVVEPGQVRQLTCRLIAVAAPGELRPNCQDREISNDLQVGLLQCN